MTTTHAKVLDFIVRRNDLKTCKFVPAPAPDEKALSMGQVLLRVDKFAFTSNNITYAALGDAMSYWNFFPAPEGWGRIPVWGFGDVVRSEHDAIKVGERFYGYFPMSTHLAVQPERVSEFLFSDGAPHRQALHALYNQYQRTSADASYDRAREDEQMLLKPLFIMSFLIDDFLADSDFFGARAVVLSSASSKTAYGAAFLLSLRNQCEIIGLTSPGNVAFTERLGLYDRVVTYDQIASLPTKQSAVYVDMAGNDHVRSTVHHHFGDDLKYSCAVGGTHWDALGGDERSGPKLEGGAGKLPGPRPTLLFAPAQIKKRSADWGRDGFWRRYTEAWWQFLQPLSDPARGWMRIIHSRGPEAVQQVYQQVLAGRAKPDEGHVLSLHK